MEHGTVNFKVFLYKNDTKIDCRRMGLDVAISASFICLKEKLETIFPTLRNTPYNISWIDADNDAITIMGDEELITAITDMTGPVKVLHVNTDVNTPDPMCEIQVDAPTTVVCDGCDKTITHFRYKCLQCPDYDLCAACEQKGHHSDHIMLRSPQPALPNCIPRLMACLSRSIQRTQMHAAREIFKADRQNRGNSCYSSFGKHGRGRHDKGWKECPFGDIPLLLNFEKLSNSLLSTFDNIANPTGVNRNANAAGSETNNAQNQAAGAEAAGAANASASAPDSAQVTPPKPTTTPESASGTSTPKSEPMYPNIPMETDPEVKAQEHGWTFLQPLIQPLLMPQAQTEPTPTAPASEPAPTPAPPKQERSNIVEGLEQLLEIGFKNEEMLVYLLKKYRGDVSLVIRDLLDNGK